MIYLYGAHIQLIICPQPTYGDIHHILSLVIESVRPNLCRLPFQPPGEHTSLQTFCASDIFLLSYIISISIPPAKPTHSHLSEIKHVGVPAWREEKHDISLKILHQASLKLAKQAYRPMQRLIAKFYALSTASHPTLPVCFGYGYWPILLFFVWTVISMSGGCFFHKYKKW